MISSIRTQCGKSWRLLPAMLAWCLTACTSEVSVKYPTNPDAVPVNRLTITAEVAVVIVGFPSQLSAVTLDANGNVLTGRTVTWSSSNANLATVNSNGVVTGVAEGTVTVMASSEGKSATLEMLVLFLHVQSVEVMAPTTAMRTGTTQQLTARTLSATGNPLPGRTVTWSSSDNAKATVSPNGLVTAVAAGPVTITAACEGRSGSASISIVP